MVPKQVIFIIIAVATLQIPNFNLYAINWTINWRIYRWRPRIWRAVKKNMTNVSGMIFIYRSNEFWRNCHPFSTLVMIANQYVDLINKSLCRGRWNVVNLSLDTCMFDNDKELWYPANSLAFLVWPRHIYWQSIGMARYSNGQSRGEQLC